MAKHVHMSLIVTYKLYHHCIRGYINNVVMSIFIGTPRSHGPSRERGRGSHINTSGYYPKIYLVKDQFAPEHIWGPYNTSRVLSTKVQDQGSTHALSKGSLEHIQGP